jgi:hypothetical protein
MTSRFSPESRPSRIGDFGENLTSRAVGDAGTSRHSAQFYEIGALSYVLGIRRRRPQRAARDSRPALPPIAAVFVVMVCSVAMRCR